MGLILLVSLVGLALSCSPCIWVNILSVSLIGAGFTGAYEGRNYWGGAELVI